METDRNAAPRQRLLAVSAALLEAIFEPSAVQVLATLQPADMRPGGARVPGTSYELEAATAARAMRALLALRGVQADALLLALAEADQQGRHATLAGQTPPMLGTLYAHCGNEVAGAGGGSVEDTLQRLGAAAEKLFTPTHARRITAFAAQLRAHPGQLDVIPVQQFVAGLVRNAP